MCDIHMALKACGYANEEVFKRVMDRVDYVMPDLKIVDNVQHKTTRYPIRKAPLQSHDTVKI